MGRPKDANPKTQQLLVRLTASEMEVLVAIAHLEGITPNALVRRLVEQELTRMSDHSRVKADIANRRAYAEEKTGDVLQLAANRTSKRTP